MVLQGATFNAVVVVGVVSLLLFRLPMAIMWNPIIKRQKKTRWSKLRIWFFYPENIRWAAKKNRIHKLFNLTYVIQIFSANFARRPSIRKTLWTCIYENILEKNLTNVNFVRCHSLKMEIYVHISNVCTVLKQMNHFWDVMSAAVLSKRYLY